RNEFSRQSRQAVVVTFRPAKRDRQILTLDKPRFTKTLAERCDNARGFSRRAAAEETDHRHCRLLRARCERPSGCRAADKCDEFPPPHGAYPKAKDHGRSITGLGVGQCSISWRS